MAKTESTISSRFSRFTSILPYLLMILVFIGICVALKKARKSEDSICHTTNFCDARIYLKAIDAYRAGTDPYAREPNRLGFVYPPIFLRAEGLTSRLLPGNSGWHLYIAMLCVGMCIIPWTLMQFIQSEWMSPVGIGVLFILVPKFYTEEALMFGNIATICYACLLAAAIPGIRRNRWSWFYVAVFFAASLKPPFLTLLILPWLGGARQLWRSMATAALVMAGYLGQRIMDRTLYTEFLAGVRGQLLVMRDAGMGFLAISYKVADKTHATGNQLVFVGTSGLVLVLILSVAWLKTQRDRSGVERVWIPVLLVTGIVSNPRMIYYDAYIAFVPAIFLYVEWALRLRPTKYRCVWITIPVAVFLMVYSEGPATGIFLLIFGSLALTILSVMADAFAAGRQTRSNRLPAIVSEVG